ncbi:MAG: alpha-amylase [Chlorobiales bacterium]|jgi:glycosidase|nr:alpha-amylase [Chlorobiales bacterium]
MNNAVKYPLIYEINTRVWLRELSQKAQKPINLANIPLSEFYKWRDLNFNAIWLMGVWTQSPKGRQLALENADYRSEYSSVLPDWTPDDVASSPYSIVNYQVSKDLGGESGLEKFRTQLAEYEIKLILDFVPNHTAQDHPWVETSPDFYIRVPAEVYKQAPGNYYSPKEGLYLTCGRDPFFPPWIDTLQLNYANPDLHNAMIDNLKKIASQCDGVRCDMAILELKEVYNQIWQSLSGEMTAEFWDRAISEIKQQYPQFLFIAEAYWNKEWELQKLGFDFTYDKRFYDWLCIGDIQTLKGHLSSEWSFQEKLIRFIENHDEPRAAAVLQKNHKVAALVTLTGPGARLVHEGQIEGAQIKQPIRLLRQQQEPVDPYVQAFYERVLRIMRQTPITRGSFHLIDLEGENTFQVIGFERRNGVKSRLLITLANFGDQPEEVSFKTDGFEMAESYEHIEIVSTEKFSSPQFDLWMGGITVRLRPHEGLLFVRH